MQSAVTSTKPHFPILDGLRGITALLVVAFHLFEPHADNNHLEFIINHGYLAVDFFFLLSGFVIGYAYDDRWGKMSVVDFFKIRLVRLQPMVIVGMLFGAACFYFQDSMAFPGIHNVPVWQVILTMLIGFTLLPIPPSMEIRGWWEMHPLNGPGWSLFYEYVANIFYALIVRKFSKTALSILVLLGAAALVHLGLTNPTGDVVGGWALEPTQIWIGLTRVTYPFFAGLLMFRVAKLPNLNNGFLWSSVLLIVILAMPRIGGADGLWMNGLYEAFSIIILFPLVVWIGAGGVLKGRFATRLCQFLGDISYPIYITHFPIIYIYTAWVSNHKPTVSQGLPYIIICFLSAVTFAWVSMKWYDVPVRKWLKEKYLLKKQI